MLVESNFEHGSFDISLELIQNILVQASRLITSHHFLNAAELATAIGLAWHNKDSLIELLKWLKGEKPERVTQVGNNVEFVLFGQKKVVSNTVNVFVGDPQMRDAVSRAFQALQTTGMIELRCGQKMPPDQSTPPPSRRMSSSTLT